MPKKPQFYNSDTTELVSQKSMDVKTRLFHSLSNQQLADRLMRKAQGIVYVFDLFEMEHIFPDDYLSEILGYDARKLNPLNLTTLSEIMHPEDFKLFHQIHNELLSLSDGAVEEITYRLQTASGSWKWFQSSLLVYERGENDQVKSVFGIATDVTTLKEKEDTIAKRRSQLFALLECTEDHVFALDVHLNYIYFNTVYKDRAYQINGTYPEKGQSVFEGQRKDTIELGKSLYKRAFAGERVKIKIEKNYDGERKIYEMSLFPSLIKNEVDFITIFIRDITHFITTEEQIREQKNLLTSIIDATHSSVFAFNNKLEYMAFNRNHQKTMKKIYGLDIEIGMSVLQFQNGNPQYERNLLYLKRALSGESFTITEKFGLKELHESFHEISFNPIVNDQDEITGISVFSNNVTERMEAARQKVLAEKKFADLFEHSPDAIFVEDICGNILDVNIAACELQGKVKNELNRKNIRDLVPADNYRAILRDYKCLFLGTRRQVESQMWSDERGVIPVEITGKRIFYNESQALLLHIRDISERKKLERDRLQVKIEKIKQKEELLRNSLLIKEQERNRIAAEIHDDIGSGLSKISVLCQVIKQSMDDTTTVNGHIDKIMQSSREVQENLNEIIWAMNPQNDQLENLVAYLNYFASEYMESNQIGFLFDLYTELPSLTVVGKIRRNIFLVVKEALHNIVKYAGPCMVKLGIAYADDELIIKVTDTGAGFNIHEVSRFKNGMKNMYNRAEDINGTFRITSLPGTGTEILLTIPLSADGFVG